jgi:hypothetical protein
MEMKEKIRCLYASYLLFGLNGANKSFKKHFLSTKKGKMTKIMKASDDQTNTSLFA